MSGSVVFPEAARVICRRQSERPEEKSTPGITLPLTRRMPVLHPVKLLKFSCQNPIGADWSGLERTSAPPRQAETLYLPRLRKRSPRWRRGTGLSCSPRSAKTANLRSRKRLPAPDLRFRLSPPEQNSGDAEVHAMLGELDFGESAVMGDATAEERQAIANFDIRAYA